MVRYLGSEQLDKSLIVRLARYGVLRKTSVNRLSKLLLCIKFLREDCRSLTISGTLLDTRGCLLVPTECFVLYIRLEYFKVILSNGAHIFDFQIPVDCEC